MEYKMTVIAKTPAKAKPSRLVRFLPILGWLPKYDKAWLMGDIIAGLSVWALMVPQSLGYASISGVPVQYGLYAAAIALLVFPLFTTSRHVVTGPSSTIAAVTGAAVLASTTADSPQAVQMVASITMVAGLLYIILAVLKMGWISNFLSESVLTGFIFGIGIDVVVGQLKKITGTTETGSNTWQKFFSWLQSLPDTNIPTLILGVSLIVILVLLHFYAKKVPGALVAVVLGIGAAMVFPLESMGVALTGPVPSGLPTLVLPTGTYFFQNMAIIMPAAIGVLLVGFSDSLAAARQYSAKYHYDIDVDQEMMAQGMSNTAAGLFQGINVDGSLSKSALNDSSGGKTQLASIAQGIFVILTLLFLAPLFASLPSSALGAIVITAVVFGLFKVAEMRRLANMSRTEFWLAMAALLGVLTFGTLQGVFIGVILSLLWLVWRSSHPAIPLLGKIANETAYYSIDNHPDATTYPGLVVIRFDGPLFFASASSLRLRVRELTREVIPPVTGLVLDMESTTLIDLEGSNELQEVAKELNELHIGLYLCRTKVQIKEMLVKDGVLETIPEDHFYPTVHAAVTAALQAAPQS
jgi:high affinity sulfate transporter 1